MIEYKKLSKEDKNQWIALMNTVLEALERKEFFMPFTEQEIEELFDENQAIHMGAYDGEELVGIAQLYLNESYVEEIKEENVPSNKATEFTGANLAKTAVLGEYLRNIYVLDLKK